jgi:hypothetical protein
MIIWVSFSDDKALAMLFPFREEERVSRSSTKNIFLKVCGSIKLTHE